MTTASKEVERLFADELKKHESQVEAAAEIVKANPTIPFITALVMAGDDESARRMDERVARGEAPLALYPFVGSYARMEFVYRWWRDGRIPDKSMFKMLPDVWSGADPDDLDPRYLELWRMAWKWNKQKPIRRNNADGFPRATMFRVFRGQLPGKLGISWTTDVEIAKRFGKGMGLRSSSIEGVVYVATANRRDVFAFINSRHESEVIVDPATLAGIAPILKYERVRK